MILTKKLLSPPQITKTEYNQQRVNVQCDKCDKKYESSYVNQQRHHKTYGMDLCRSCKQVHQYDNGLRVSHFTEFNKSQKGKSLEERFGEQKAKKIKEKLSNAVSGEKNPMYGKHKHTYGISQYAKSIKGKTNGEIYGCEKAQEISKKLSLNNSGENNPMYGKPSPIGSGNGWSGWYNGIYFRSILELSYLKYLIDNNIKFENGECSKYAIQYIHNNTQRNYFCDFVINEKTFIEVKPYKLLKTEQNKAKFSEATKKHGKNFKIITERDIIVLSTQDIINLYQSRKLRFIKRYDEKYKVLYEQYCRKEKQKTQPLIQ